MNVLYFHQHFSTPGGATATRSYEMARKLIERGHRVTMVCGSYGAGKTGLGGKAAGGLRRGDVDGIDVIELSLPYSNSDSFARRTATFLRYSARSTMFAFRESYDLLFASSTPLTAGIPGIVMKRLRARKFVFEVRDLWPELPEALGVITSRPVLTAMKALEWASYRSADACIALSPGIREGIVRRGVDAGRVQMIPNGCDLQLFRPGSQPKSRFPGVGKSDFVALFTGTHGLANGLDAALDAAGELMKRGEASVKLVFMGDGLRKPALRKRARAEGLDNCIFLDPVPKRELPGYLNAADAGLMLLQNIPAFYYGTSPNKFFDYISAGLPVLNNYPGWVADLIVEHGCGVVVGPDSPGAFADGLLTLRDRADLERMGYNARGLAEREFNREVLAGRFAGFLEEVGGSPAYPQGKTFNGP